jgi:hypothetical protein
MALVRIAQQRFHFAHEWDIVRNAGFGLAWMTNDYTALEINSPALARNALSRIRLFSGQIVFTQTSAIPLMAIGVVEHHKVLYRTLMYCGHNGRLLCAGLLQSNSILTHWLISLLSPLSSKSYSVILGLGLSNCARSSFNASSYRCRFSGSGMFNR